MPSFSRLIAAPLCALLLIAGAEVHAQGADWQLAGTAEGFEIRVDQRSIKADTKTRTGVQVTWRKARSENIEEMRSVVDCKSFEFKHTAGSSISPKNANPAPIDLSGRSIVFAFYTSVEGLVADRACRIAHPQVLDELQSTNESCAKPEYNDLPTCRFGPEFKANERLFSERAFSLPLFCGDTDASAEAVHGEYIVRANTCQDSKCAERAILDGLVLVSRDLELGAVSREVSQVPATNCRAASTVASAKAEQAKQVTAEDALNKYAACTKSKTQILDDRTSSPEMIAGKIHEACKPLFVTAVRAFGGDESDSRFYDSILPRLVKDIQDNRAKGGK